MISAKEAKQKALENISVGSEIVFQKLCVEVNDDIAKGKFYTSLIIREEFNVQSVKTRFEMLGYKVDWDALNSHIEISWY